MESGVRGVVRRLTDRGETVATAESLTAGLVCATLTQVPGSSAAVRGGLIVYATELKTTLVGVDLDVLAEHGAVHPEVASQLATGARVRCGASWGLGLTGVAGPTAQDGAAVGTVHVGLAGERVRTVRTSRLDGDRAGIRSGAVSAALSLLGEHLS